MGQIDFHAITKGGYDVAMNSYIDSTYLLNSGLKISELSSSEFNISPNPTTGQLTIDLLKESPFAVVSITNAIGKEMSRTNYINESKLNIEINGGNGLYIVRIVAGEKSGVYRVVKIN